MAAAFLVQSGQARIYKEIMTLPIRFLSAFLLIAVLAMPRFAAAGGNADGFVDGIEDLPLMSGLAETEGGSLIFDSAAGRVVEAYAVGAVDAAEVTAFYGRSLPQLGWTQVGPTMFRREGEILVIEYIDEAAGSGPLTVRFAVSPADG